MKRIKLFLATSLLFLSCEPAGTGAIAFTGAVIFDGRETHPEAVIVVRDGRIESIASNAPVGAEIVDLEGRFVVPGLINAHGHVGGVQGLDDGHYTTENLVRQLKLYARYGITTIVSLGGDGPEGVTLRDAQNSPDLDRARLFVAGAVVTGTTAAEAVAIVDENVELGVDFIKIRVDDNLGSTVKMSPEVFGAVIDQAAEHGIRVASHLYYLDDAKELLRRGTGFIAHSIRDQDVDAEFLTAITDGDVCYSPTLMREVSTFVYETEPAFFSDPFFLESADPGVLEQLKTPARQESARRNGLSYKPALEVAMRNLEALFNAGVPIAFGTDTGPAARFQGYFEHMELEMMEEAGMPPAAVLASATVNAATCLELPDVGFLSPGAWADFVVLEKDPMIDISNMRTIESVWIAGNQIER